MRMVLDASVAVASARLLEPHQVPARARVVRILTGLDEIVVPPIFAAEVAGSLARHGHAAPAIRTFVDALLSHPNRVKTFGPRASRLVAETAWSRRLRGADACYVWIAQREGLPLCTLDQEMADRAAALCEIVAP